MNQRSKLALVVVSTMAISRSISFSQTNSNVTNTIFSEKRSWNVSAACGTLYQLEVGITHELSKGSTIGVLFASGNHANIFGIRLTERFFELENGFVMTLSTPVLYYPAMENVFGGVGTLFLWPVVEAQWVLNDARVFLGAGVASAVWIQRISVPVMNIFSFERIQQERSIPAGYFRSTIHAGFSLPIVQGLLVQLESNFLVSGFQHREHNWLGGSPAMLTAEISYTIY